MKFYPAAFLSLIFILTIGHATQAQKNLVPNGGFEAHKSKRNKSISNAAPWGGVFSVDYYLSALDVDTSRFKGPHSGEACVGLRFQLKYKEFLFVKLLDKLKPGEVYHFEAFFRLFAGSPNSLKHMGVVFSKKPLTFKETIDSTNSLFIENKKGLNNNFDWVKLSGEFKAKGGERYITLGNFVHSTRKDMYKMNRKKLIQTFHEAYYFFDDISLKVHVDPVDTPKVVAQGIRPMDSVPVALASSAAMEGQTLAVGDKFQLKSIFFETGKAELKDDSYPELDSLATLLDKNTSIELLVSGHTDATGNEELNQKLSEARAKAVFDYLIEKGISNEIDYKGFGSTVPIASNDSEEGRKLNRRVEIQVTKR